MKHTDKYRNFREVISLLTIVYIPQVVRNDQRQPKPLLLKMDTKTTFQITRL